jgi:heme/copper-type cytochrome/quinol oxidase subunit 2
MKKNWMLIVVVMAVLLALGILKLVSMSNERKAREYEAQRQEQKAKDDAWVVLYRAALAVLSAKERAAKSNATLADGAEYQNALQMHFEAEKAARVAGVDDLKIRNSLEDAELGMKETKARIMQDILGPEPWGPEPDKIGGQDAHAP